VLGENKNAPTFNVKSPCSPQPVGEAEAVGDTNRVANVEVVLASRFDVTPKISELLPKDEMLCADEGTVLPDIVNIISDVELAEDTEEAGLVRKISEESVMLSEVEVNAVSDDELAVGAALGDEVTKDVNLTEPVENNHDDKAPMLSEL
jgi:hypothetical protein